MALMLVGLAVFVAIILVMVIAQGSRIRDESLELAPLDEPELPDWVRGAGNRLGQAVQVYAVDDEDKPKQAPSLELAAGIRDLLDEGRKDEAVEIYQKFAGVDQYTAQDAIEHIEREMRLSDDRSGEGDGYYDDDDFESASTNR